MGPVRSPWEDAAVPLQGVPERSWMPGCVRNAVDVDESARLQSQWLVGLMGCLSLATLHLVRLTAALSRSDATRETVVFVTALCGLFAFLVDLQRCRMKEGMYKLVALLVVADVVIPALWPPCEPEAHELDESERDGLMAVP